MSLDVLPAEITLQAASGLALTWTGHYAAPAALFEIRPPRIPRDVRPVFDEDLDCIIGYQRGFGERYHLYDLNGDMMAIWEGMKDSLPAGKRDPLLVVGGLWAANVRGITALALPGTGSAMAATTLALLRKRFSGLSPAPLLFTAAGHANMDDPKRFVPVHILRLAMRHGERIKPPPDLPGAARYLARMTIRRRPYMLDVVTANANATIVQFEYWAYADTLPAA
ncbi:hypothetical protein [Cupriavidus campinensis]